MNKLTLPLAFVATIMLVFISCQKDETVQTCPVDYTIDTEHAYDLEQSWKFVGFEDKNTGKIDPPLCGNIQSWITFSAEENERTGNKAYSLPNKFYGVALINHFSGTYQKLDEENTIELSSTVKTTVNGTPQVKDFEARFHNILMNIDHFEIENNELFLYPYAGTEILHFVASEEPVNL